MQTVPDLPTVLITGAAKRIGAAIARRFAQSGWHVLLHYNHSEAEAQELADSLPSAQLVQCDLADGNAASQIIDRLAKTVPDWRAMVLNASLFEEDHVTALDPATNDRAMQVNMLTPVLMAQRYFASAQSQAGRCAIQLTDQKLANPNPDFFSYSMSKFAVDAAAEMMAMASDPQDRIYRLAPGAILPSHDQSDEDAEISHRMNLLGRRTDANEVADAALFLANGFLASGQQIFVDSGQHLLSQPRDVIYLARQGEGQS